MDSGAVGLPPGFVLDQAPQADSGGLPPGFVLDQPSTGMDIAKGAGQGLVNGLIGTAGMGGDIREMGLAGANKLSHALTGSDMPSGLQTALDYGIRAVPGVLSGPSSADIKSTAGNIGVPNYQPQTTAGKIAKSFGEFVPAAFGGEASLLARGARVAVPALASEGAGELAQGTAAEPYARAGGALLGAIAAHRATAPAVPAPIQATSENVLDAARNGYNAPEVTSVRFRPTVPAETPPAGLPRSLLINQPAPARPGTMETMVNNVLEDLDHAGANSEAAPRTRAIVNALRDPVNPANGGLHSYEDFQTARTNLGVIAGGSDALERRAASIAIQGLDRNFQRLTPSDAVAGDIPAMQNAIAGAKRNYALGSLAQRVEESINRADVNTSSAHSGGNFDNATRQALKPFLLNPKKARGMSDADIEGIGDVVAGSATGNALRAGGKLLGGGGGLGAFLTALESAHALGPIGVAAPFVGYGLKRAGDAITRRNAQAIVQNILARSPEAQRFAAMNARYAPAGSQGVLSNAVLSALLSSASPRALLPYQQGVAVQ